MIADELNLIIPGEHDVLRVTFLPIFTKQDMAISTGDSDASEEEVLISYPKENGFEICNGVKSAVNNLSLMFESTNDAQTAQDMVLKAQENAAAIVNGGEDEKTDAPPSTPEPKRSLALVNLWSPEGLARSTTKTVSNGDAERGPGGEDTSPLQHRSQPLPQANVIGSRGGHRNGSLNSATASETSFLEAAQDRQGLTERLQASQDSSLKEENPFDFNERVDDAVARYKPLTSKPEPVAAQQPRKEGATAKPPPPLPNDKGRSPKKPAATTINHLPMVSKTQSNAVVQLSTRLVGTVALLPESPAERSTGRSFTKDSMAKLASGSQPAATASKKSTKTPGGPAARLAGSQLQKKQQSSTSKSSPGESLKRKSFPSNEEKSSQNIDWDQDLRDDSQFDIPNDPSDDERPTKKARKGGKQSAQQPTARSSKKQEPKKGKAAKDTKKPAGRPPKTRDKQPVQVPKHTAATTRERRAAKSTKYAEDSRSDSEGNEDLVSPNEAPSPVKNSKSRAPTKPDSVQKTGIQRRLHSQLPRPSKDQGKKQEEKSEEIQPQPVDALREKDRRAQPKPSLPISAPKSPTSANSGDVLSEGTAPQALQPAHGDDDNELVEVEAQDSYPMDNTQLVAARGSEGSFRAQLQTQLQETGMTEDADKENVPPPPQTPFGDKKSFVANVNAARVGSLKKGVASQVQKSPEVRAPASNKKIKVKATELRGTDSLLAQTTSSTALEREGRQAQLEPPDAVAGEDNRDLIKLPNDGPTLATMDDVPDDSLAIPEHDEPSNKLISTITTAAAPTEPQRPSSLNRENREDRDQSGKPEPRSIKKSGTTTNASVRKSPGELRKSRVERQEDDTPDAGKRNKLPSPDLVSKELGKTGAGDAASVLRDSSRASKAKKPSLVTDPAKSRTLTFAISPVGQEKSRALPIVGVAATAGLRTPLRDFNELEQVLTSERMAKKPSVVQFGPRGPANQGVPGTAKRMSDQTPDEPLPPPETVKHQQAKRTERRDESAETPSHQPNEATELPTSSAAPEQVNDGAGEGITVEDDLEHSPSTPEADLDPVPEAAEEFERDESPASVSQPLQDPPDTANAEPATRPSDNAAFEEIYVDTSMEGGSSADSSEMEDEQASEYEDESEVIDTSQEMDQSHERGADSEIEDPARSNAEQSANVAQAQDDQAHQKHEAQLSDRQSIGLSKVIKGMYPRAESEIKPKALRSGSVKVNVAKNADLSAITQPEFGSKPAHMAGRVDLDDNSRMPPPKMKPRQSIGNDQRGRLAKGLSARQGSLDENASADQGANPKSVADSGTESTALRTKSAPIRLKPRSIPMPSPEPFPLGTPVTFHAKLAETSADAHGGDGGRHSGSYASEDTSNATLVNGNSMPTLLQPMTRRGSRYEREMTESTDDSPPPSSIGSQSHFAEDKTWREDIRNPNRNLFDDVMQVANVSARHF